jgi:hypothetical protein
VVAAPQDWNDVAFEQLRAGFGLLTVSKLVHVSAFDCRLSASLEDAFETAAAEVDPEYGRVASWILFSAGAEYLLKGICLLHGWLEPKERTKLRPPMEHETIGEWVKLANAGDATVKSVVADFGTLGDLPLKKLAAATGDESRALAAFTLFRSSIRNRDAHYYAKGVRAAHFRVIPDLLVPALNGVLALVSDRPEPQKACQRALNLP